jgi:hypothetical protein
VTERRSVSDGQQRFGLTIKLASRGMAYGKDASKAGNEAMLGHEPSNRARAHPRREELPARHTPAL